MEIGLAALLGYEIDGRRGLALALVGLLVPSTLVTVALAIMFVILRDEPWVHAVVPGMAPATIGLTLAITSLFAWTSIRGGRRRLMDLAVVGLAVTFGYVYDDAFAVIIVGGTLVGWLFLGEGVREIAHDGGHPVGS